MKSPLTRLPGLIHGILIILFLAPTLSVNAQNYVEALKIGTSDGAAADAIGVAVSISGDFAFVAANGQDGAGINAGAVYVFELKDGQWMEAQKLIASDAAEWDNFGCSVSVSGTMAIIGANQTDDQGGASGSAYIFEYNGGTWIQNQKITASDAAAGDQFGRSVCMSGSIAIVGSPLDDDGGDMSGSAYIFALAGNSWVQKAKITASDGEVWDQFGNEVGISGDHAIVSSTGDDMVGMNSGAAYIYKNQVNSWTEMQKLTAADAHDNNNFGVSVTISGNRALIGANGIRDASRNAGAVYAFNLVNNTWVQTQQLVSPDPGPDDHFGCSVSNSGDMAIIGAFWDDEGHIKSGAAYIYEHDGSIWTGGQKLMAAEPERNDWFGNAVGISGNNAIVGARGKSVTGDLSGAAFIFSKSSSGISPLDIQNSIRVFPNPSSGVVNFDFGNINEPSIQVFTLQGKLIHEEDNIQSNDYKLHLEQGKQVYLVKVISGNQSTVIKLIRE